MCEITAEQHHVAKQLNSIM